MIRMLLLCTTLLLSSAMDAQRENTLFNGNHGIKFTGVWGGWNSSLYDFQDNKTLSNGGYLAFEFNQNFLIGWSGYQSDLTTDGRKIDIDGNDLLLGYTFKSDRVIHPILNLQLGSSRLKVEDVGSDRVFVVQPSIGAELNITRFFRLGLDAGYRHFSGSDLSGYKDSDFSGPVLGLRFKFGWSWHNDDWDDDWDDDF